MPLHPQAQTICDVVNALPPQDLTPEGLRAAYSLMAAAGAGTPPTVARVEALEVPGPAGPVPVRLYAATDAPDLPVLVFVHGGGWVIGSLDDYDARCRHLAEAAGCLVVSVGYRLAPEHPFPAGLDDAWAALRWAAGHAGEHGGDPSRLAVMGDSAGGNLAAVLAILARDASEPRLAAQVLVYPVIDHGFATGSYRDNGTGYMLEEQTMRFFYDCYLRGGADPADWRISPLRAPDLAGVAPALVVTAEFDPLRDEGEAYAARLAAAGVEVRCSRYDGMIHSFFGDVALYDDAKRALDEVGEMLRAAFGSR